MKVNYNQFLSLVYSDLFDYPLTYEEMKLWSLSSNLYRGFANWRKHIASAKKKDKYYFLKGRERLVEIRRKRERISEKKLVKLSSAVKLLKRIPTVRGIFLTGSVAAGNAKDGADLDLMIVTSTGRLWTTRFLVVGLLKILGMYPENLKFQRNRVCTNLFLDMKHLEIKNRNLYSAHEVLQAKCLFDCGGVEKMWLQKNEWVGKFLPEAYAYNISRMKHDGHKENQFRLSAIIYLLYIFPELIAFLIQYFYMQNKISNERVGFGYAFFHPRDLSSAVMEKFEFKIKKMIHMI